MKRSLSLLSAVLFLFFVTAGAPTSAKDRRGGDLSCDDSWHDSSRASHCEIREAKIADFGGRLDVDPGMNGGVSVRGWDSSDVLVRYKVQTQADTDAEARSLAGQVTIETAGGRIRTAGPTRNESWSVTFQISVPRRSDVTVQTYNGGIALSGLTGSIKFEALNGGVALDDLAGDVKGNTTNGGLAVNLTGNRWDGEGMDVFTINGGVSVAIPSEYSAQFETGTVHGGLALDFPITVKGKVGRSIETTLGSGGAPVRIKTTNGGVNVKMAT